MTTNQLRFWENVEKARSNRANEYIKEGELENAKRATNIKGTSELMKGVGSIVGAITNVAKLF